MSFNSGLSRDGPGLLVRDLMTFEAPDLLDFVARVAPLAPDILVLQDIDYDHQGAALSLLQQRLTTAGLDLPHRFARRSNAGRRTPFDLDRNGYLGDARDAQGYGVFSGQGGMAILSRFPILEQQVQDYSGFLWRDLPGASLPQTPKGDYYMSDELAVLRLHAQAAWRVPVETPDGVVTILTAHASPPVFDGPEDRNGLRNGDEINFWTQYLSGWAPVGVSDLPSGFLLVADLNNDPVHGEGLKPPLHALLSHPNLSDPLAGMGATANWDFSGGPGLMRVDYILPSRSLRVENAGMGPLGGEEVAGSRHAPVWVDITLP